MTSKLRSGVALFARHTSSNRIHASTAGSRPPPSEYPRGRYLLLFVPLLIFMIGMARLETKMARATVVFGEVFQARWRGRWNRMQGRK